MMIRPGPFHKALQGPGRLLVPTGCMERMIRSDSESSPRGVFRANGLGSARMAGSGYGDRQRLCREVIGVREGREDSGSKGKFFTERKCGRSHYPRPEITSTFGALPVQFSRL